MIKSFTISVFRQLNSSQEAFRMARSAFLGGAACPFDKKGKIAYNIACKNDVMSRCSSVGRAFDS